MFSLLLRGQFLDFPLSEAAEVAFGVWWNPSIPVQQIFYVPPSSRWKHAVNMPNLLHFNNPPVRRGVGSHYVTLQHFSAAFDFSQSPSLLAPPLSSHPLYPLGLALCVPHICSRSLSLSSSVSLSPSPVLSRGFTPHCGHRSFTALLFLNFSRLLLPSHPASPSSYPF